VGEGVSGRVPEAIVISAGRLERDGFAPGLAALPYQVLNFTTRFELHEELKRTLPSGWTLVPMWAALNDACARARDAIVNLDAPYVARNDAGVWWDSALIGERGPFTSELFLNLCRLELLVAMLREGRDVFIVSESEDEALAWYDEITKRRPGRAGWRLTGMRPPLAVRARALLARIVEFGRGAAVRIRRLAKLAARKSILGKVRRNYPVAGLSLDKIRVLIFCWTWPKLLENHSTSPSSMFLGDLAKTAASVDDTRLAYLLSAVPAMGDFGEVARGAVSHPETCLLFEDALTFRAAIGSAIVSLFLPFRIKVRNGAEAPSVRLVKRQTFRDLASWDITHGLCYRAVMARLGVLGLKPNYVVHPYEHQPWEKMITSGLRDIAPDAKTVAVQHVPLADSYFSVFPSSRALREGVAPDVLLVAGRGYRDWFCKAGFPEERIKVVGALRFQRPLAAGPVVGTYVLCSPSNNLDDAIELAVRTAQAAHALGLKLVVSFHPITNEAFRQQVREKVASHIDKKLVEFSGAPVKELIDEAMVLVYSISAASFDALFAGKPVIYLGSELRVGMDKVPAGLSVRCHTTSQLEAALRDVQSGAGDVVGDRGSGLRHWLGVVSHETIRGVLTLQRQ
jgi:hypothetical protein